MFNTDELKGKWKEVKGEVVKKWGELTDSDLDRTEGNAESLVGVIQQKFGMKKEEVHEQLTDIAAKWREKGKEQAGKVADVANNKIDQAKTNLKN